jgi:hypothetical protein
MSAWKTVLALVLALGLCAPAWADGSRCTVAYPRGFKVAKGTKERPVNVCKDGHLQSTWGGCELRYRA